MQGSQTRCNGGGKTSSTLGVDGESAGPGCTGAACSGSDNEDCGSCGVVIGAQVNSTMSDNICDDGQAWWDPGLLERDHIATGVGADDLDEVIPLWLSHLLL